MLRALLLSSVGHVVVFAAFAFELDVPLFAIQNPDPIEVEIIFEDEPMELAASADLLDLSEPAPVPEDVPEDSAALEPETTPALDPLFLPDSTEQDADLPDGLEPFVNVAEVNSNLRADLSKPMEAASTDDRAPANDQFPRPDETTEQSREEGLEDLIAALEARSGEEATKAAEPAPEPDSSEPAKDESATPPRNMPLIPKPRPRAAPDYRDLAQEQRDAEAAAAAELAAAAAEKEADTAAQAAAKEAAAKARADEEARRTAAEDVSERYVQNCVDVEWIYPNTFIRFPQSWQVGFTLSLDGDGEILEDASGDIAYEDGATEDMVSAFVESARNALYGCAPFINPTGGSGEPFEIKLVMQPKSSF
jgi:hypothetical protein